MDLSDATTDELLNELMSRQEAAVYIGRPKANRDYQWQIKTVGPMREAAMLAALAQYETCKATCDGTMVGGDGLNLT